MFCFLFSFFFFLSITLGPLCPLCILGPVPIAFILGPLGPLCILGPMPILPFILGPLCPLCILGPVPIAFILGLLGILCILGPVPIAFYPRPIMPIMHIRPSAYQPPIRPTMPIMPSRSSGLAAHQAPSISPSEKKPPAAVLPCPSRITICRRRINY